jgi:hypothetical protein
MAYKLQPGENATHAAMALFGDARAVNELDVIDGYAYVKGESHGPPTKWAAAPPSPPPVKASE